MPCLAFRLPSTGSTTTSGSGAPKERRPTSSDKTENCMPRSATTACSSSKTTASAARSSSIVLSPPAPIASCCRPASVPASGATTSRTRAPMRRNVSSQCERSAARSPLLNADRVGLIAASGFGGRGAGVDATPAAAAALDHDGDQVGLLHPPHLLDELRDRYGVRPFDAQKDQPLRQSVGELGPVVQVHLLQGFEDVIKTAQTGPAILILRTDHRALELISL